MQKLIQNDGNMLISQGSPTLLTSLTKVWPWGQPILMKIGLWVGLVVSWKVLQGKILFRSIIDFFGRRLFSDITPSASSDDDENSFSTIILVLEFTGRSFV